MTISIDPARRFQLWEYHISHGSALVRSPRGPGEASNIDIMLFGVEYMALPRHLEAVRIEAGTEEERRQLERAIGREVRPERVWAIISAGLRHLVVAAKVEVRETITEIFESPFSREEGDDGSRDPGRRG